MTVQQKRLLRQLRAEIAEQQKKFDEAMSCLLSVKQQGVLNLAIASSSAKRLVALHTDAVYWTALLIGEGQR